MQDYVATKESLREDIELCKDEIQEAKERLRDEKSELRYWTKQHKRDPFGGNDAHITVAEEEIERWQAEIDDLNYRLKDLRQALREVK